MRVFPSPTTPTEAWPGIRFSTLVAPRLGASDIAMCRVDIDPDAPATPHSLTREEIFFILAGDAAFHVDGTMHPARPGDTVLVPAHTEFAVANVGTDTLELLVALPIGGQLNLPDGTSFTPTWAA